MNEELIIICVVAVILLFLILKVTGVFKRKPKPTPSIEQCITLFLANPARYFKGPNGVDYEWPERANPDGFGPPNLFVLVHGRPLGYAQEMGFVRNNGTLALRIGHFAREINAGHRGVARTFALTLRDEVVRRYRVDTVDPNDAARHVTSIIFDERAVRPNNQAFFGSLGALPVAGNQTDRQPKWQWILPDL